MQLVDGIHQRGRLVICHTICLAHFPLLLEFKPEVVRSIYQQCHVPRRVQPRRNFEFESAPGIITIMAR
jgi:hypothetical protein